MCLGIKKSAKKNILDGYVFLMTCCYKIDFDVLKILSFRDKKLPVLEVKVV